MLNLSLKELKLITEIEILKTMKACQKMNY